MRLSLSRISVIVISLALIPVVAPIHAQNLPATPHTPDLLGIYPGMPMNLARAMLQKHSSQVNVQTNAQPEIGFSMNIPDPRNRDQINVFLTRAPNAPAVWMIQRSQNFDPGSPMSQSALLTALRQKYGKETLTWDRGGGGLYLYWIFDQSGHLLTSADQGLQGCSGNSFVNYIRTGPPQSPNTIEQSCFRSFFAVTAMLNRRDAQLLEAYTVELVNMPYAVRVATVTMNANNAAADQAKRNQLNKANQKKPVF
jgi:hypothetical protein